MGIQRGKMLQHDEEIIGYFKSGYSAYRISKLLHCDKKSVLNRAKILKLDFGQKRKEKISIPKRNNDRLEEIAKMFNRGFDCIDIYNYYNIPKPILQKTTTDKRKLYNVNMNFFDSIDNEEKSYLLGLFYSDGCVYKYGIRLSLNDLDIVEMARYLLQFDGPITKSKRKHQTTFTHILDIGRVQLKEALIKNGCGMQKSLNINFPYKFVSSDYINHFIRGYFDGDGSIYVNKKGGWRISLIGTREMMEGILNVSGVGGRLLKSNPKNNKNTWTIHIEKHIDVYNFINYLYEDATVVMSRKTIKCNECMNQLSGRHQND